MEKYSIDCLIVGAGVAGLSIGRQLANSYKEIVIIDKNGRIGEETTSRNSEVIHAGIYYKPNSYKANLSVRGKQLLYEYLKYRDIEHNKCGKYIISNSDKDSEKLEEIKKNALENGVDDLIFLDSIKEYEFIQSREALYSPSTGIFDSHSYLQNLSSDFKALGGHLILNCPVSHKIDKDKNKFTLLIQDNNSSNEFLLETKVLINCGGINSYQIANSIYEEERYKPKYMKGDYYSYAGKEKLRHLIYPAPQEFSLGIHATIDLGSGIRFGPSAYEVNKIDYSIEETKKQLFLNSVQSYWPSIKEENLYPSYSGIRPLLEGEDDFVLQVETIENKILGNILGYASPGLTSSLALAEEVERLIKDL